MDSSWSPNILPKGSLLGSHEVLLLNIFSSASFPGIAPLPVLEGIGPSWKWTHGMVINTGRNKKAGVWKKQGSSQKEWSVKKGATGEPCQSITPGSRSREHSVIISFASGIMIKLWIMILINSTFWFYKCPYFPNYILTVLQDQSQDYKMSLESWLMMKYNVWTPFACCTIPPEEKLAFDNIHAAFTFYSYCQTQSYGHSLIFSKRLATTLRN